MNAMPNTPQWLRMPCFQFSLRLLLLLVTLAGLLLGSKSLQNRRERTATEILHRHGITTHYNHQHDAMMGPAVARYTVLKKTQALSVSLPRFIPESIGREYFHPVTAVVLGSHEPNALRAILPALHDLPHLREIYIWRSSCLNAWPSEAEAEELLKREFPHLKITPITIDIVG